MIPIEIIVIPILTLLVATAITIARIRNLWAAVMFTGIYSFLGASWMLILDAPDVAFTEAAVGAGISTFLMLATLALTPRRQKNSKPVKGHLAGHLSSGNFEEKPSKRSPIMPLIVVTITGCALIYGTLDMPKFGSIDAPIQVYPDPSFVAKSQPDMHGLPNVVTAVLASYRGYDTLGETAVIFTAGLAVLLILRKTTEADAEHEAKFKLGPDVASDQLNQNREANA